MSFSVVIISELVMYKESQVSDNWRKRISDSRVYA